MHACRRSIPAPSALVLNFPSNPTAQVVDLDFYKEAVRIAKENDLVLISDLAYSEIYFDGNPPPSILEVEGAKDVAVEFTSMSKTYSMPGWRMGFAAGSSRLVDALKRVKSYLDYGAFTPIQIAAVAALDGPQDHVVEAREIYKKRRDVLVESFGRAGFDIPSPPATMFAWAPIPERFAHLARWNSPRSCWKKPMWPSRRGWALASAATAMCAWRSWRTSSASARRRAP